MHAIWDGLDTISNNFDQVLKDQGGQVNLVVGLDMVHEPIVDLAHCGMI